MSIKAKIVRHDQWYKVMVKTQGLIGGWICVKIGESKEEAIEMLEGYAETQTIKPELVWEGIIRDDGNLWEDLEGSI